MIAGIILIVMSAIILSAIQFCANKSKFHRYRRWLHLVNVILLTISLVVLVVGFYLLQHVLQQPLNGKAALGFFIGILFIVMLGTHSTIMFWSSTEKYEVKVIEEMKWINDALLELSSIRNKDRVRRRIRVGHSPVLQIVISFTHTMINERMSKKW